MIKQPMEMDFNDKKFAMIIYGSPGVGKTTLALSAPEPIIIDFDRGISRVSAQHRKTAILCDKYEDVLQDIESPEVAACQTIIIDTGGSFVSFLQDWAMRSNPTLNRQKNGAISLKGFGAVKQEFSRFTSYIRDVKHKNLIYIFHSEEKTDKDGNSQQRLMCEGASKNLVWTPCDFGGYVQMIGNDRTISFTPEQEFFAKGCHGIKGRHKIPELGLADENNFVTRLFEAAKQSLAAENEMFAPMKEQYDLIMVKVREIVEGITDVDSANAAAVALPALDHALTSKKEASAMLQQKTAALGLIWSKANGSYIGKAVDEATAQEDDSAAVKAEKRPEKKQTEKLGD